MSSIPPISSGFPIPFGGGSSSSPIIQKIEALMEEYSDLAARWEDNPSLQNTKMVEECMERISEFLTMNKEKIFDLGRQNGWPPLGLEGYETFYDETLDGIQGFLKHPGSGGLDQAFEGLSRLYWLLTTKNVPP